MKGYELLLSFVQNCLEKLGVAVESTSRYSWSTVRRHGFMGDLYAVCVGLSLYFTSKLERVVTKKAMELQQL